MDQNELDALNLPWSRAFRRSSLLFLSVTVVVLAQLLFCMTVVEDKRIQAASLALTAICYISYLHLSRSPRYKGVWQYKTGSLDMIDYYVDLNENCVEEPQADGSLKITSAATEVVEPGDEVDIILINGPRIPARYSEALRQRFCEPGGQVVYRQRFDRTFGNWEYELVDDPTLD